MATQTSKKRKVSVSVGISSCTTHEILVMYTYTVDFNIKKLKNEVINMILGLAPSPMDHIVGFEQRCLIYSL